MLRPFLAIFLGRREGESSFLDTYLWSILADLTLALIKQVLQGGRDLDRNMVHILGKMMVF